MVTDAIGLLDCGHPASAHGETDTGYGVDPDGKKHCYECCHAKDREDMKTATSFFAYLSRDGASISNWAGRKLGTVTTSRNYKAWGFGGQHWRYSVRVVDLDGRRWYGTSPGPGMYCRLRPFKNQ